MRVLRRRRLRAAVAVIATVLITRTIVATDRALPPTAARPIAHDRSAPQFPAEPTPSPSPGTVGPAQTAAADLPASIPDTVDWPDAPESAVTYAGAANVTTHGIQRALPIASIAKVMTAYVILTRHPLAAGDGPSITVTAQDAAQYSADADDGQSVTRVEPGEQLTERQALEALLLRSANNVATLLADWDAGSVSSFTGRMNDTAARLGMRATRYADPAGVKQETVSSAADQVRLCLAALRTPGFADLVDMPEATVPVVGTIYNYDTMLGVDGIVGVKTGYTRQAGGTMLIAARASAHGRAVLLVGALLGESGNFDVVLGNTLGAGDRLVASAEQRLSSG